MTGPQRILYVVVFALGLSSCATTTELRSIPDKYGTGPREESVVIGRVVIDLSGGSIKPIGFFDRLDAIRIKVETSTTGESYWIVCDQTGSDSNFFVALPPGQYRITQVQKGQLQSKPFGRFTVGKSQVVYIGTLKFTGRGLGAGVAASVLAGRTTLPGDWLVEDEYLDVAKSFRERFPHLSHEVVKSLVAQ